MLRLPDIVAVLKSVGLLTSIYWSKQTCRLRSVGANLRTEGDKLEAEQRYKLMNTNWLWKDVTSSNSTECMPSHLDEAQVLGRTS